MELAPPLPNRTADELATVHKALADPTRIQMLHMLKAAIGTYLRLRFHRRLRCWTANGEPSSRQTQGGRLHPQLQARGLGVLLAERRHAGRCARGDRDDPLAGGSAARTHPDSSPSVTSNSVVNSGNRFGSSFEEASITI